jgi:hypothetical protein
MTGGGLPIALWRREPAGKKREYAAEQTESRPLYAEVKQLWEEIRTRIDRALEQERKADQTRQKIQEQGAQGAAQ